MRYVVSACLAGVACRYDGGGVPHPMVWKLARAGEALTVCPEVLGGLGVPRPPCELVDGRARTPEGRDCHDAYCAGAAEALRLARAAGCTHAVLKARSPSCGAGCVYDGTFSHTRIPGDGVFAALLRQAGFILMTEEDLPPGGSAADGGAHTAQRNASSGPLLPQEGPEASTQVDAERKPRTGCGCAAPSESGFRAFPPGGSAADGGAHTAQRDASSGPLLPQEGPEASTQVDADRKPRTGCGCAAPSESGFRAFPPGGSAADGGAHTAQRDASSV